MEKNEITIEEMVKVLDDLRISNIPSDYEDSSKSFILPNQLYAPNFIEVEESKTSNSSIN